MNKDYSKRITAQRLRFPTDLKFIASDNGLLECNGKLVQVVASELVLPIDYPPVDFKIFGIGKYKFILIDADIIIFSFANVKTRQTDCTIIGRNELVKRLKPYHYDGGKINLKLILSERGLNECYNAGAEAFFMGLWVQEFRNFTNFYNSWQVFQ